MLGNAVFRYFTQKEGYKLYGVSRQAGYSLENVEMYHGDLTSEELAKNLSDISFHTVIHCSAEVNVNLCENKKELAYTSNVIATKTLFSNIKSKKYIYISTDAVFNGKSGNYSEEASTAPGNYYALSKLLGEEAVKETITNYYILRTNIYGFNNPMKKSLFEWGYSSLKEGSSINGFDNMYFNPMYVGQLAKFIENLTNSNTAFGVYNVAADEKISKYEFLIKIAKAFGFSTKLVQQVTFEQDESTAPRALNTTLNNTKVKKVFEDFDFSIHNGFSMLEKDFTDLNNSNT